MIVGWTGHRPDLFRDPLGARAAVDSAAREFARKAAVQFRVGGQRGVDTWAALSAIELTIPFAVILPAPVAAFTADWSFDDVAVFEETLEHAQNVRIVDGYSERNQQLVSGAELLVAVWTRIAGGGTAETVDLARQAGIAIHEIVQEAAPGAEFSSGRGR